MFGELIGNSYASNKGRAFARNFSLKTAIQSASETIFPCCTETHRSKNGRADVKQGKKTRQKVGGKPLLIKVISSSLLPFTFLLLPYSDVVSVVIS